MLAMTPDFDGVDDSLLESFLTNNDILVDLIKDTDHQQAMGNKVSVLTCAQE